MYALWQNILAAFAYTVFDVVALHCIEKAAYRTCAAALHRTDWIVQEQENWSSLSHDLVSDSRCRRTYCKDSIQGNFFFRFENEEGEDTVVLYDFLLCRTQSDLDRFSSQRTLLYQ